MYRSFIDKRKYSIDFLKLFFTLVVILHHSGIFCEYIKHGYTAVEFFFFISGAFICCSADKKQSIVEFLKKRLIKLYPGYLIAFVLLYIFRGQVYQYTYESWYGPILEILMLQNVGIPGSGGLNYPLWYLSVLFYGGILVFIMCKYTKKITFNVLGSGIVALVYGYLILCIKEVECWKSLFGYIYIPFWRGIADMIIGAWIYRVPKLPITTAKCVQVISLVLSLILMLLPGRMVFFVILFLGILVYSFMSEYSILDSVGKNRVLIIGYQYQYYAYLNHALAIYLCGYLCNYIIINGLVRLVLVYICVFVIAIIAKSLSSRILSISKVMLRKNG